MKEFRRTNGNKVFEVFTRRPKRATIIHKTEIELLNYNLRRAKTIGDVEKLMEKR